MPIKLGLNNPSLNWIRMAPEVAKIIAIVFLATIFLLVLEEITELLLLELNRAEPRLCLNTRCCRYR